MSLHSQRKCKRRLPSDAPKSVDRDRGVFVNRRAACGGDYYDFISFDNTQLRGGNRGRSGQGNAGGAVDVDSAGDATEPDREERCSRSSASLLSIVSKLNRLLFNTTNGEHYDFLYATFDPATQLLTYVNAGHNPPLYLRADADSEVRQLTSGGLVRARLSIAVTSRRRCR